MNPRDEVWPERSFAQWPLCFVSWFLTTIWREAWLVDLGTGKKNQVGTRASTQDDWDGTAALGGAETRQLLQI